jgi:hypothetical protein
MAVRAKNLMRGLVVLNLITAQTAIAQTANTIQVGDAQLRLGMTIPQVRALVTPAFHLHSPRDQLRLGPLGQANPAGADSMASMEERLAATDTSYAAEWTVDRTNAPPWGDVATLWFKRDRLVYASVSWIPVSASFQGALFVRQLHRLLTNLQTAGYTRCRIKTSTFPTILSDEPNRDIEMFCGPRHVTMYVNFTGEIGEVNLQETIGHLRTP